MTAPSLAVRGRDVLASEWTKFRSVRSTYWTMLVAVVTPIGASALVAAAIATAKAPGPRPDPLLPGFVSLEYAVIAVGILGVLTFTTEYTSGLIRTTFTAVPRRWAVLAAKAAVTGAVTLVAGELVAFVSFSGVQAILSGKHRACPSLTPVWPEPWPPRGRCCACVLCSASRPARSSGTPGGR